jgi:hypothetical protein
LDFLAQPTGPQYSKRLIRRPSTQKGSDQSDSTNPAAVGGFYSRSLGEARETSERKSQLWFTGDRTALL